MMDPFEAWEEEAYAELYAMHRDQALEEDRSERLRAYYLRSPDLAKPAFEMLAEAQRIAISSPTACFALATASAEVGLKVVLLRPIVSGLVISESLAGLIAELAVKQQGLDRFRDLLVAILRQYGEIDFGTHSRPGSAITLWQEIKTNVERRNGLYHRCAFSTDADASNAIAIASEILEKLFPRLIANLGMHLHDGFRVCAEYHMDPGLEKLLANAVRQRNAAT